LILDDVLDIFSYYTSGLEFELFNELALWYLDFANILLLSLGRIGEEILKTLAYLLLSNSRLFSIQLVL